MKSKLIMIFTAIFLLQTAAFAKECNEDLECPYDQHCVMPEGSTDVSGTCTVLTDKFGSPLGHDNASRPHIVPSCFRDSDCSGGGTCIKRNDPLHGFCSNLSAD